jgi:hypothetical protein
LLKDLQAYGLVNLRSRKSGRLKVLKRRKNSGLSSVFFDKPDQAPLSEGIDSRHKRLEISPITAARENLKLDRLAPCHYPFAWGIQEGENL